ncbi:MAG: alpha/beta hydrolase [Polyangiaceae bacterium]
MSIEEKAVVRKHSRGPALHALVAKPEGTPRYAIGLVHGYADHAARYKHVIEALREKGIATVALDLRGHGRSDGARGFCGEFSEFWDDLRELGPLLDDVAPGVPRVLFGHSFGGLATASSLIDERGGGPKVDWKVAIWSAPFFELALPVPALKKRAGELLGRIMPKFGMASGLHGADLTHDTTIARGYDEDPLVFKKANARWFTEAVKTQEFLFSRADRIKLPFFIGFGGADKVASPEGGRRLVARAGSAHKEFKLYDGLYHEILNEPSWRDILSDMLAFAERHMA